MSAYWFYRWEYAGFQFGYTKFTANAQDANDASKAVFLEADGVRGALLIGHQFKNGLFLELAAAGRYFPSPKAVTAPLSSTPFGALSVGVNFGVTFGKSLNEIRTSQENEDKGKKEQDAADTARRVADEQRWAEEKEFRRLQMERWNMEDAAREPKNAR